MLRYALDFVRAIPSLAPDGDPILVYLKPANLGLGCRGLPSDSEVAKEHTGNLSLYFAHLTKGQQRQATAFALLVRCLIGTARLWLQYPPTPDLDDPISLDPGRRQVLDPETLLLLDERDLGNLWSIEKMEEYLRNVPIVEMGPYGGTWATNECAVTCAGAQQTWHRSANFQAATMELA